MIYHNLVDHHVAAVVSLPRQACQPVSIHDVGGHASADSVCVCVVVATVSCKCQRRRKLPIALNETHPYIIGVAKPSLYLLVRHERRHPITAREVKFCQG